MNEYCKIATKLPKPHICTGKIKTRLHINGVFYKEIMHRGLFPYAEAWRWDEYRQMEVIFRPRHYKHCDEHSQSYYYDNPDVSYTLGDKYVKETT